MFTFSPDRELQPKGTPIRERVLASLSGLQPNVAEIQVASVRMNQLVHATNILLGAQGAVAIPQNDIVGFVMNTLLDLRPWGSVDQTLFWVA